MVYVYYCKNSLLPDEVYKSWLRLMPPGFVQKINKLVHRHDAQASLLGRIVLLYALRQLGYGYLSLGDLRFNVYQRPYFDNTDLDFNISHSGDYVLCAIGKKSRVGIDIEEVKPVILDDFTPILSPDELEEIVRHPKDKLDVFYTIWTQKEALVKAEGSGLNFPMRDIRVKDGKAVLSGSVWYLHELPLVDGYKVQLAFRAPEDENTAVYVKPLTTKDMVAVFWTPSGH
jgi:4'-phosphopantetheinyl transferase